MLLDKGVSTALLSDLLQTQGQFVDQIKLSFGTAALIEKSDLEQKIKVIREAKIDVLPGGTLFELAFAAGRVESFFEVIKNLGFNCCEISDGSIALEASDRKAAIQRAKSLGFIVLAEVGKKDPALNMTGGQIADAVSQDLDFGADFVVIEARESGQGVGIFNESGAVRENISTQLKSDLGALGPIIWEAPQKSQQARLIKEFGPNVNLGNIPAFEIVSLEALRRGLRWDTRHLQVGE